MAAVDITCPHCNRNQKVAEHRLKETVYCLLCQQLITDVYLYKVAPKQQELTIKLKGRIVSEFGTTKLDELKSKSDEYTGRFEPVDDEDSSEVDKLEETTRLFDTGAFRALPERKKLSTAARTYLIGGVTVAVLAIGVTFLGVAMLKDDEQSTAEIDATSADGTRSEKYPSGTRKAEWRVINSGGVELMDGPWQEWHEDGSNKTLGNYTRGEKVGVWRGWHANGRLSFEAKYESGGAVGPWIEWHANGRKAVEGAYVNGEKHGEWRSWHNDGSYAGFEEYDHGKPIGDWMSRYPDGQIKLTGTYVDGLREGRWIAYHDNGAEERVENWKNGLLDGENWGAHRNRQKSFQGNWKNGRREGTWKWWYPNGRTERAGDFFDGAEQGTWQEWHANGKPRLKGTYNAGVRVGSWEEFDEDGYLICRRDYTEGMQSAQAWFFRDTEVVHRSETFPDGRVRTEWTVIVQADGKEIRHGHQRTYYSNGALAESGSWLNGNRDGHWRTFDEAGNTLADEVWKDGTKAE